MRQSAIVRSAIVRSRHVPLRNLPQGSNSYHAPSDLGQCVPRHRQQKRRQGNLIQLSHAAECISYAVHALNAMDKNRGGPPNHDQGRRQSLRSIAAPQMKSPMLRDQITDVNSALFSQCQSKQKAQEAPTPRLVAHAPARHLRVERSVMHNRIASGKVVELHHTCRGERGLTNSLTFS